MALTVEQLRTFDSNWGNLVVQQDANGQKPSFSAGESRLGTTERFTVSKDEKGAITVGFSMRFEAPNMVLDTAKETKDAKTNAKNYLYGFASTDAAAVLEATMDVTFSAENFDRLGAADWSKLKTEDLRAAEKVISPHMFENLPNNVEEPYRFTGDVSTSFIVQAEQINLLTA